MFVYFLYLVYSVEWSFVLVVTSDLYAAYILYFCMAQLSSHWKGYSIFIHSFLMDLIDPLDIWENCYCLLRPGKQSCPPSGISWYFYVGFFTCFPRQPRDWFWKVQPWYIQFNENFQNNLNGVNSFIRKSKKGPRGALCIPYLTKCQEEQPIQFFSWSISFYPSSRHITLHKHTYKANLKVAGRCACDMLKIQCLLIIIK